VNQPTAMHKITLLLLLIIVGTNAPAQLLKKLGDKVKKEISKTTDKPKDTTAAPAEKTKKTADNSTAAPTQVAPAATATSNDELKIYGSYDFVPGDSALFVDDLQDEELNEIPSKWVVKKGKLETAQEGQQRIMTFYDRGLVFPRMKKMDYLPKRFTIEFDIKWPDYTWHFGKTFKIKLYNFDSDPNSSGPSDTNSNPGAFEKYIQLWNTGSASFGDAKGDWPISVRTADQDLILQGWQHIAIAVNEKSIKLYINQYRILNAQLESGTASSISLSDLNSHRGFVLIKNFRVMRGGKNPYKQVTTEKVYIARGIQFELGSAQLKPESMGEINRMVQLMKDNADLKFEIGGHASKEKTVTAAVNQKLSEDRSNAVRNKMIEMGIDAGRLTAKGYGDTKPIGSNDTPEGRATNRRVEFVRQ